MPVSLDEILRRYMDATRRVESGQGVVDDLNDSFVKSEDEETNAEREGSVGSDESDTDPSKKKRRRYKGKRRTNSTGRTWVKLEDPQAPRRPRSAYVLFLSTNRGKYGTRNQGADQSGINVALAGEWQKLSDDERQVFIDEATEERATYEREMETYRKTPSYYEFALKKTLVMKQRKLFRQAGLPTDQASEEAILKLNTDELETLQSAMSGGNRKRIHQSRLSSGPSTSVYSSLSNQMVENTDVPIFSQQFIEYNRQREADLRNIRRSIGIAESEQNSLKKNIHRLENELHSSGSEYEVESTLQNWLKQIGSKLQGAVLPTGEIITEDNMESIILEVAECKGRTADQLKELLSHVKFVSN